MPLLLLLQLFRAASIPPLRFYNVEKRQIVGLSLSLFLLKATLLQALSIAARSGVAFQEKNSCQNVQITISPFDNWIVLQV